MNKDEAGRCLSIARDLTSSDLKNALKFAHKSYKLHPTDEAKEYIHHLESKASQSSPSPSTHQQSASQPSKKQPSYQSDKKYTKEQAQAVKVILSCESDYYKVLSLEKKCTDKEIKKAYRKLALQFHPDKNCAPGADEAFKLISKAFTVLSDSQKRAIHDAGGGDPEQRGGSGRSHYHSRAYQRHTRGDDISAEELFNMFFGGGNTFGGAGLRQHTRQHPFFAQRQQRAPETGLSTWLQLMPLLLLFAYAIVSSLFSSDSTPAFSFQRSTAYPEPRMTQKHNVKYYVNPTLFRSTAKDNQYLARTERHIESSWVHNLQDICQREQTERSRRLVRAGGGIFGLGRNEARYQEALRMPMTSCEELKKFGIASYHHL